MSQSRAGSLLEAMINTASGFVLSLILWRWVVAPAFGLPIDMQTNLLITGIFTIASVARSYLWRRFFNTGLRRWLDWALR